MAAGPLHSIQAGLRALKEINSGLHISLESQVVTRADRDDMGNKVRIISGGGAGHEPAHTGFVGRGLLTTAISGAIFTSPPVQAILQGILMTGPKESEILMIVKNYSGDRLNFALAEQMARVRYGYKNIQTILVADDVSLDNVPEQVGNRGLAGTVLIHKIAGAMAEMGKSLAEVHGLCQSVSRSLKTIGFSYEVGSLDGKVRDIEIGKGCHGEPGAYKIPDQDGFRPIAKIIADKFRSITTPSSPVVLLLNNLGGPPHLFHLICHALLEELNFLSVVKVIAGTFFTSLGHSGASVTVLELPVDAQAEILSCLEFPTELFWENFRPRSRQSLLVAAPDVSSRVQSDPVGVSVDGERLRRVVGGICQRVVDSREHLNRLDAEFGDGDTGDTLSRGALAILDQMSAIEWRHPFNVFQSIGHLVSSRMGGTSGALLGLFFECAAEGFKAEGFEGGLWLRLGIKALAEAGRSRRGDRTMLDVLLAVEDLFGEVEHRDSDFLLQLKTRSQSAAEATKDMIPGSGRAVYNRTNAEENHGQFPDPGAVLISMIVDQVVKSLLEQE